MKTKSEVQNEIDRYTSDLARLNAEIRDLEQQRQQLDLTDTTAAVANLEEIDRSLTARRQMVTVINAQLILGRGTLAELERQERLALAGDLIKERDQVQREVVTCLQALSDTLQQLDGIEQQLMSKYRVHSERVFSEELRRAIKWTFDQTSLFHRDLFGLPAKNGHDDIRRSAEQAVERLQVQVTDLKKRQGKVNGGVHHEDVVRAEERLHVARQQLERIP